MSSPFFSINIPAYNCGQYINLALASVQSQSFSDWEIVIVDDGSTDDTLQICTSQSIVPSNKIRVIKASHSGQYLTRKKLIENSSGKYIISLDADDELIGSDALSSIAAAIESSGSEVVLFNATRSLENPSKFVNYSCLGIENGSISANDVLTAMACTYSLNNICFKAYRRNLWRPRVNNRVIENTEDRLQCAELLNQASGCYLIDSPLYYYRQNPNSVTNSSIPYKFLQDLVYVEDSIADLTEGCRIDERNRINFLNGIFVSLLVKICASCSSRQSRIAIYKQAVTLRLGSSVYSNLAAPDAIFPKLCMFLLRMERFNLLDYTILFRNLLKS